mgnify:CR=1 FL=1
MSTTTADAAIVKLWDVIQLKDDALHIAHNQRVDLTAQRDDLLAALGECITEPGAMAGSASGDDLDSAGYKRRRLAAITATARAAIAKATA